MMRVSTMLSMVCNAKKIDIEPLDAQRQRPEALQKLRSPAGFGLR
jgi:hypothetical protein